MWKYVITREEKERRILEEIKKSGSFSDVFVDILYRFLVG